jgi:hypothetical protein
MMILHDYQFPTKNLFYPDYYQHFSYQIINDDHLIYEK